MNTRRSPGACRIRQCNVIDYDKIKHTCKQSWSYSKCLSQCVRCQMENSFETDDSDRDALDDSDFADPGGHSSLRATNTLESISAKGVYRIHCPAHPCHAVVNRKDNFCRKCGHHLNQRNQSCPTCYTPNVLTPADVQAGYHCNRCADALERYG